MSGMLKELLLWSYVPRKLIAIFLNNQLPLNEDGNNIDKQLSYMNYKKAVRTFHDIGWKNSYHTSHDVSMLGYGCGVYQCPHFFVEDLNIYQMLPRPYIRSFDSGPGDKLIKQKWVLDLANWYETFVFEFIESRIMSDDPGKQI